MRYFILTLLSLPLATSSTSVLAEDEVHLFILSGQSNMAGLKPEESFIPTVEKKFGKEHVIVIKDAQGGQPIRRWYKDWKSGRVGNGAQIGDLYDRLMKKVVPAIKDVTPTTVSFVWMQGERDAREGNGDVYAAALKGVVQQLRDDLKHQEINLVIGRLSDFDLKQLKYPHWNRLREVQVQMAEDDARTEWVDTDDLNDGLNRRGQKIENDLHYSAEGYKTLGSRFAEKCIKLIEEHQ